MKRVGIITYHRATNYGAVLQAYSLLNILRKEIGQLASIEIIDYSTRMATNDHHRTVLSSFLHDGFGSGMEEMKKNRMFCMFSNSLVDSKPKIISDDIKIVNDFMNCHFDIVISGSDAVFSWNGKKFPSAYLLGEEAGFKRMSYAASAHRLKYYDEPPEYIDYCERAFSNYYYLGVRDSETERFVKYCLPDAKPIHNCDPSFLIDLDSIKEKINYSKLIHSQKPVIFVMTQNEKIGRAVNDSFGHDYCIVSLFVKNKAIKNHLGSITPFEWACIFSYGVLTVTEYFHATIFSLLNGVPVVSIDSSSFSNGYEGKIHDLLCNRLHLNNMYINIDDVTREGEGVVTHLAHNLLTTNNRDVITAAINNEKQYYLSFQNSLTQALS